MLDEDFEAEQRKRETSFRVKSRCCANCLFGQNKLVSDERKEQLLTEIVENDAFFVCHEGSEKGQTICCRSFYDRYKTRVSSLRLVQFLDRIYPGSLQFVEPVEEGEV